MKIIKIALLLKIFIFQVIFINACAQDSEVKSIRTDYLSNLNTVISQFEKNQNVNAELLEKAIPISKQEFIKFYEFFEDSETRQQFESLDEKIGNNAYNQLSNFFELYIKMAEFISSETVNEPYLSNYYYDLDFIIEKNTDSFCKVYKELDENKKINLRDFYEDYCE